MLHFLTVAERIKTADIMTGYTADTIIIMECRRMIIPMEFAPIRMRHVARMIQ